MRRIIALCILLVLIASVYGAAPPGVFDANYNPNSPGLPIHPPSDPSDGIFVPPANPGLFAFYDTGKCLSCHPSSSNPNGVVGQSDLAPFMENLDNPQCLSCHDAPTPTDQPTPTDEERKAIQDYLESLDQQPAPAPPSANNNQNTQLTLDNIDDRYLRSDIFRCNSGNSEACLDAIDKLGTGSNTQDLRDTLQDLIGDNVERDKQLYASCNNNNADACEAWLANNPENRQDSLTRKCEQEGNQAACSALSGNTEEPAPPPSTQDSFWSPSGLLDILTGGPLTTTARTMFGSLDEERFEPLYDIGAMIDPNDMITKAMCRSGWWRQDTPPSNLLVGLNGESATIDGEYFKVDPCLGLSGTMLTNCQRAPENKTFYIYVVTAMVNNGAHEFDLKVKLQTVDESGNTIFEWYRYGEDVVELTANGEAFNMIGTDALIINSTKKFDRACLELIGADSFMESFETFGYSPPSTLCERIDERAVHQYASDSEYGDESASSGSRTRDASSSQGDAVTDIGSNAPGYQ